MSKTDKTNQFWVKVLHGDVDWVEHHDHTDGVCDMPPAEDAAAYTYGTTQCRREFIFTGTNVCGCWMCHCRDWPLTEARRRRRDRRRARQELRVWHREYE